MDCWFGGSPATCRAVAHHARRIEAADLSFPIILSADGGLMDGGHRIAKALLRGDLTVAARQFDTDPSPDWIETGEEDDVDRTTAATDVVVEHLRRRLVHETGVTQIEAWRGKDGVVKHDVADLVRALADALAPMLTGAAVQSRILDLHDAGVLAPPLELDPHDW